MYRTQVLADGPVSYWTFDESAAGTGVVLDSVGNNDGSFQGATVRTAGLIDVGAAQFSDSNGEGVNVGNGGGDFFKRATTPRLIPGICR